MGKNRIFHRRQFLVIAGTILAGTGLAQISRLLGLPMGKAQQAEFTLESYLPLMFHKYSQATSTSTPTPQAMSTSTPTPQATSTTSPTPNATDVPPYDEPCVVHVHATDATNWDFSNGWYGDYIDQGVVYQMVDQGLMRLTGATTRAAAWQAVIPNYVTGQIVAIKVNLNNASSVDDNDNFIDALIQPVNAVIRGLVEIGVVESDIWVYDAIRSIPDRFKIGCDFPGVQFSGYSGSNYLGFSETERVTFEPPPDGPSLDSIPISNVLVNADYMINMPIMKVHTAAKVTLSFKNHFGSICCPGALHEYIRSGTSVYTPDYNPMVDIYKNHNFVDKTVLTIGDGLFGCWEDPEPKPWITFNNQAPNGLLFSKDPVALDCVMYDFLDAEVGVQTGGDDYLKLAAQEMLGVFEHRSPGASNPEEWYSLIDYVYLNMN